ncbi:MAG TPA: hypothetical protein PKK26_11235, partial [Candidatus Wallbacteria bacterium]|nr:hypothetical protein [Candidatus Wallbacteria bacterium]
MYDITPRAATARETQILKLRLNSAESSYALYYAAAAVLAGSFVVIAPRVFGTGILTNIIISLLIFIFAIFKILEEKNAAVSTGSNIRRD